MGQAVTVNIITGFLGVGTTFVQQLIRELQRRQLTGNRLEKIVYIANELGSVGLDAGLIREQGLLAYDLTNGCICCTLKADFNRLLRQVIEEQAADRIIFEPSGLFALSELFQSLADESWCDRLQFGAIVCLIDARRHKALPGSFNDLLANQAALSDILAVSKLNRLTGDADETAVLIDAVDQYPDKPVITRAAWDMQPADWSMILDWPPRSLSRIRQQSTRRLGLFPSSVKAGDRMGASPLQRRITGRTGSGRPWDQRASAHR